MGDNVAKKLSKKAVEVHIPNKSVNIRIFHQNVEYLREKVFLLKDFLVSEDIDIMCITEVGLKDEELLSIKIENYVLTSHYCRSMHVRRMCHFC